MTETERTKILERIKKLLALTKSPNENEAALAAEKAQEILATYNLSMADVEQEAEEDPFEIDREVVTDSYPWRRHLGAAVAKLYFCDYFYATHTWPKRRDHHSFVGQKHNIAVAKVMFVYLTDTVERLAREGARQVPENQRSPYRVSFRGSCTSRLCARIYDRIRASKEGTVKTSTGTTLPALANLYDQTALQLKEFMAGAVPNLKTKRSTMKLLHAQGAADGRAAGDRIGLDPQVSGRAGHLLK